MPDDFVFIDTNTWVAWIVDDHVFHDRTEATLNRLADEGNLFCLSNQTIRELISVCSSGRGLSRPLSWLEIQQHINSLLEQCIFLHENETTTKKLVEIGLRYVVLGKQIHDTNIVATMLVNGVTRLVTLNPADFKRFPEIELIVP